MLSLHGAYDAEGARWGVDAPTQSLRAAHVGHLGVVSPRCAAWHHFEPADAADPLRSAAMAGLGLAASLRIAQLHGGTIVFRDRPHTQFEMVLPLTDVGPHGLPDVERPPSFTTPSSGVSL